MRLAPIAVLLAIIVLAIRGLLGDVDWEQVRAAIAKLAPWQFAVLVAGSCWAWCRWGCGSCSWSGRGDEVDELLDPAEERRLEVGVGVDAAEDVLPGPGDVGLVGVRPAQGLADAVLPLGAARDRPATRRGRGGRA